MVYTKETSWFHNKHLTILNIFLLHVSSDMFYVSSSSMNLKYQIIYYKQTITQLVYIVERLSVFNGNLAVDFLIRNIAVYLHIYNKKYSYSDNAIVQKIDSKNYKTCVYRN